MNAELIALNPLNSLRKAELLIVSNEISMEMIEFLANNWKFEMIYAIWFSTQKCPTYRQPTQKRPTHWLTVQFEVEHWEPKTMENWLNLCKLWLDKNLIRSDILTNSLSLKPCLAQNLRCPLVIKLNSIVVTIIYVPQFKIIYGIEQLIDPLLLGTCILRAENRHSHKFYHSKPSFNSVVDRHFSFLFSFSFPTTDPNWACILYGWHLWCCMVNVNVWRYRCVCVRACVLNFFVFVFIFIFLRAMSLMLFAQTIA